MSGTARHIGEYEILEPIGRGGMGVVYRARHTGTGALVALKTIQTAQKRVLQGIRREILVLRRIQHPGIVRVLDVGVDRGLPWLALELLEGISLREHLNRTLGNPTAATGVRSDAGGPSPLSLVSGGAHPAADDELPPLLDPELELALTGASESLPDAGSSPLSLEGFQATAYLKSSRTPEVPLDPPPIPRRTTAPTEEGLIQLLTLVRRLCSPLAYLHGEGIVHRDLKPENILLRPDGTPVLVDFGLITQFQSDDNREAVLLDSQLAGSVNYMAPEQFSDELIDARADLYALGCILFELLTGVAPFASPNHLAITYGHLFRTPPTPSSLVPGIPEELDRLVLRLLAKKPNERLGYAEDLGLALTWFGARGDFTPAPPPRPYLYRPRFVGRSAQLELLRNATKRARRGAGCLALVGGESGIGKTRLAAEAAQFAARQELLVISGRCLDADNQPLEGFRAFLRAVADRCRERGRGETERVLGRRGPLLSLYEPQLEGLEGLDEYPAPVHLPERAARERLSLYLLETLRLFSVDQPLMMVIDDLHWADPLTLEVLTFAVERRALREQTLLIVGMYRTEECGPALQTLREDPSVEQIELERLDEAAVASIVSDMLALPDVLPQFSSVLAQHAEGNPFFIAEYLHAAVDEGVMWRDASGRWRVHTPEGSANLQETFRGLSLPSGLRLLIERRLDGLPPDAHRLVQVASVLGRTFSSRLVTRVTGLSEDAFFIALQELIRRQVFEETSRRRMRFVHEKLREVAYQRLETAERQELHHQVAVQIELLYPQHAGSIGARLGYHWEQAGRGEAARLAYEQGANDAIRRYAFADAERLLRACLRLTVTPDERACQLQRRLASAVLYAQGRLNEARILIDDCLRLSRGLNLPQEEASALYFLAHLERMAGQLDLAWGMLSACLELSQQHGLVREQGIALEGLAEVCSHRGEMQEAQALFARAIEVLEATPHRHELGVAMGNMAILLHSRGLLEQAEAAYRRTWELLDALGNIRLKSQLGANLGLLHLERGRLAEARQLLETAQRRQHAEGDRLSEATTLWFLSTYYRQALGDLNRAEAVATEALGHFEELRAVILQMHIHCELGHIALARGASPAAALLEARTLFQGCGMGPESESGQRLRELEASIEARQRGERLFRGNRVAALPDELRRTLERAGQIERTRDLPEKTSSAFAPDLSEPADELDSSLTLRLVTEPVPEGDSSLEGLDHPEKEEASDTISSGPSC